MSADTPFGRATEELLATLHKGVRDTDISSGPPREDPTKAGLDVHLLGGRGGAPAQHPDRRQQPVTLEYVVALAAPPDRIADLYHDAWVTVYDSGMFEVVPDGVPAEFWTIFAVPPRPALRVSALVRLERELPLVPLVTETLIIHNVAEDPVRVVRGRVLMGDAQPVAGAAVSPVSSRLSTTTDAEGRFALRGAFAEDTVSLQIQHRHRRLVIEVAVGGDPTDIQLQERN